MAPVGDSEGLARAQQQLHQLAATDESPDSSATSSPPMLASGGKQGAIPASVDPRFAGGAATELPPPANTCARDSQAAAARAGASSTSSPRDAANPTALSGSASEVLEERHERGEAAGPTSPSERASVPLAPAVYLKACLLQVGVGDKGVGVCCRQELGCRALGLAMYLKAGPRSRQAAPGRLLLLRWLVMQAVQAQPASCLLHHHHHHHHHHLILDHHDRQHLPVQFLLAAPSPSLCIAAATAADGEHGVAAAVGRMSLT